MEIFDACRVDGFKIPRGEPAPAVVEIGRPTGKTQSRQIKGYGRLVPVEAFDKESQK
jgi:hypothetical protein